MGSFLRTAVAAGLAGGLFLAGATSPSSPVHAQAAARSRWWDEIDAVAERIAEGHWRKADRQLERLRKEVLETSWREPDLGDVLAELAFQAALVAANRGREDEAIWEWHVALNHDRAHGGGDLPGRDLSSHGAAGQLLAANPLRRRGEPPPGAGELPGPGPGYEPAEPPAGFQTLPLANASALRERPVPVLLEILVEPEGRIRHPVVLSSWSHPVVIQWGLDNLRQMGRLRPARVGGEPVPALQEIELEVETKGRRW